MTSGVPRKRRAQSRDNQRKNAGSYMAEASTKERNTEVSKREQVLDAAERLFAEGGYNGVSMRDIATAAEVGLPLVVYHFKTKLNLYRELFERRKAVLDERLALLHEPLSTGEDPLEHIVRAFVLPVMTNQDSEAGIAYAKLVAREASDPREVDRGIVAEYFDPFAVEFIRAIREVLPGISSRAAHWFYLFAVGALVMSVFDNRIERISGGEVKAMDLDTKTEHLVAFIKAGIHAGINRI